MPKNDMMTQKQIEYLRKTVRYKWIPGFMLVVGAFFLFFTITKLLFVDRLCSLSGLTWGQVLSFTFTCPDPTQTYKGIEILAADGIKMAMFNFGNMLIVLLFYFFAKRIRVKDILLLEYIDKEQRSQPPVAD